MGTHRFAGLVIGLADDSRFHNAGVTTQYIFDFVGVHVETGDDDHVFQAIDNLDIAIFLHHTHVTGAEETVLHGLGRFFRTIPVTLHHLWPADHQFAHFANGQRVSLFVPGLHFGSDQGGADGAQLFGTELVQGGDR